MSIDRVSSASTRSQTAPKKSSEQSKSNAAESKQRVKGRSETRARPEPLFPPRAEPSQRQAASAKSAERAPRGTSGTASKAYAAEEKKEITPEEYFANKPVFKDEGEIPKGGREVTIWGRSKFLEKYFPKLFQDIPFRPKEGIPTYTKAIPLQAWQNEDGSYALKSPEYGFEVLENIRDPKRDLDSELNLDHNKAKPFKHDSPIFGDPEIENRRLFTPGEHAMIVEGGEYVRNPNLPPHPIFRFADGIEAYFFTTEALKTAKKMGYEVSDASGPVVRRVIINEQPSGNRGYYVPTTRNIHLTETGDYPEYLKEIRVATPRIGKISHEVFHGLHTDQHGPVAEALAIIFSKKVESDLSEKYPSYPLNIDYYQIEEGRANLQEALTSSRREGDPYDGDPQKADSVRHALGSIFRPKARFANEINGRASHIMSLKHLVVGTYRGQRDNQIIEMMKKEKDWGKLQRLAQSRSSFVLAAFWHLYNDQKSNIGKTAFDVFLGNGQETKKRKALYGDSSMDFAEIRETTIARAKRLPYPSNAGQVMEGIWNKIGLTEHATKFYADNTSPNDNIAHASARARFLAPYISSNPRLSYEELVGKKSTNGGLQFGKYGAPFMVAAGSATTIRDFLDPKLSNSDKLKSAAVAGGMTALAPELYMAVGKVAELGGNKGLVHKGASLAARTLTKYPVLLPVGVTWAAWDVKNAFEQPTSSPLEKTKSLVNLGTTGLMFLGPIIGGAALGVNVATQLNLLDKPIEFALNVLGQGGSAASSDDSVTPVSQAAQGA
jgi:hypothetical protein